jgi:DNA-binding IclR family transcriptional regulator
MSTDRFSRVFEVLELLVAHPEGLTLTEISRRLGLPTSSGHNLLQRMVATDVLTVNDGPRYSVGGRAVRLGIRIIDGLEVRAVARRHLHELSRATGEDTYLAVPLGDRVVYVDRVPGTRPVGVEIRLGQSLYLHATAVGKLFAAHHEHLHERLLAEPRKQLTDHTLAGVAELERELGRIRNDGHAVSREEAVPGVVGLAVPVRDAHGDVAAAVHIAALRARLDATREGELLAAARATASAIERELGLPLTPVQVPV